MRKPSPAIRGATTSLGFAPALVFLAAANYLYHYLTFAPFMCLRINRTWVIANTLANTWMLGLVALAYVLWVFALARRWVTAATGGGFVIAGAGLIGRIVAEMPHGMAQMPLAQMRPPGALRDVAALRARARPRGLRLRPGQRPRRLPVGTAPASLRAGVDASALSARSGAAGRPGRTRRGPSGSPGRRRGA